MSFTKQDIETLRQTLREEVNPRFDRVDKRFDGLREEMAENTRTIISHFNKSQSLQNESMKKEFTTIDVKLDALMEESVVRKELRNLVGELHDKGIAVDSEKVFLTRT